jgi:hypothetical protein
LLKTVDATGRRRARPPNTEVRVSKRWIQVTAVVIAVALTQSARYYQFAPL